MRVGWVIPGVSYERVFVATYANKDPQRIRALGKEGADLRAPRKGNKRA